MPKESSSVMLQEGRPPGSHRTACKMCRQRKVKCNKIQPCNNCTLNQQVCEFLSPIRTVRRAKKQKVLNRPASDDTESLLQRLERLETLLTMTHSGCSNECGKAAHFDESRILQKANEQPIHEAIQANGQSQLDESLSAMPQDRYAEGICSGASIPIHPQVESTTGTGRNMSDSGVRIGIDDDFTYWHSFEDEVTQVELSQMLSQPTYPLAPQQFSCFEDANNKFERFQNENQTPASFPFKLRTSIKSPPLLTLPYRRACWTIFVQNVDPVVKILHKPTVEPQMMVPSLDQYYSDPVTSVLIHAVCLIATASMSGGEIRDTFGGDETSWQSILTAKVEQDLMAASFLTVPNLTTLQALVLYLYALKQNEDSRFVTLSGIAVRLADQIRLSTDCDPSKYSLLEIDLRRRLWWQILVLVDRLDDCEPGPFAVSINSYSKLPLNVDDRELSLVDKKTTRDIGGSTEASFCLMQYEIIRDFYRIAVERSDPVAASGDCKISPEEDEQKLVMCHNRITSKYLQYFTREQPLGIFVSNIVEMILIKRRLLLYTSSTSNGARPSMQRDRLLLMGLQILRLSRTTQADQRMKKWNWLSSTYFQWHVTSLVLQELAVRPRSYITNQAWQVVDGIFDNWPACIRNLDKARAINELMAIAICHRDRQNLWNRSLQARSIFSQYEKLPTAPLHKETEIETEASLDSYIDNGMNSQLLSPIATLHEEMELEREIPLESWNNMEMSTQLLSPLPSSILWTTDMGLEFNFSS